MAITKKARTSTERGEIMADLDNNVVEYDKLKAEADDLADRIKTLQAGIIEGLDSIGATTHVVVVGDAKVQVTRVQNKSVKINEGRFRKAIGATVWNKVSSRKLDKAKLDAAIQNGVIAPIDVADASDETVGSPFIRMTRKK